MVMLLLLWWWWRWAQESELALPLSGHSTTFTLSPVIIFCPIPALARHSPYAYIHISQGHPFSAFLFFSLPPPPALRLCSQTELTAPPPPTEWLHRKHGDLDKHISTHQHGPPPSTKTQQQWHRPMPFTTTRHQQPTPVTTQPCIQAVSAAEVSGRPARPPSRLRMPRLSPQGMDHDDPALVL